MESYEQHETIYIATFKPYLIKRLYCNGELIETKYKYMNLYDYCVYIENNKNKCQFNGKIQEILEPFKLIRNPILEVDQTKLIMEIHFKIPESNQDLKEKLKEFGKSKIQLIEQLKYYFSEIYGNYYEDDKLVDVPFNSEWLNNTNLFNVCWMDDIKINIGIGLCFIDCKKEE